MATTRLIDRQNSDFAVADCGIKNIGAGNEVLIGIPVNALLLSIAVYTDTAFNSATTATATVSDGTTTFASAVDVKTAGAETVANAPKFYPSGGTLTVSFAETGAAATAGRVFVVPQYVILNRGDSIQA